MRWCAKAVALAALLLGAAVVARAHEEAGHRNTVPVQVAADDHGHDHGGGHNDGDSRGHGQAQDGKHDGHDDHVTMSDARLAAAGIELGTAGPATLHQTLRLNGVLRANQETLVQVTPRFPGIARDIRKRIGDVVQKGELLAIVESNQSLTSYELRAPIGGTIIERLVSLGEYVSEQKPAFVVADLSTVWVDLFVYRKDLSRVRVGDEVMIDPDDGGGEIGARLFYIAPVGASDTQTALARVALANRAGRLRPGLFVRARLILARRDVAVAVKVGALQTLENKTVVFVREGDALEARAIEIGHADAEHAEVKAGLTAGETYVSANSFVVKAERGKSEADHGH